MASPRVSIGRGNAPAARSTWAANAASQGSTESPSTMLAALSPAIAHGRATQAVRHKPGIGWSPANRSRRPATSCQGQATVSRFRLGRPLVGVQRRGIQAPVDQRQCAEDIQSVLLRHSPLRPRLVRLRVAHRAEQTPRERGHPTLLVLLSHGRVAVEQHQRSSSCERTVDELVPVEIKAGHSPKTITQQLHGLEHSVVVVGPKPLVTDTVEDSRVYTAVLKARPQPGCARSRLLRRRCL